MFVLPAFLITCLVTTATSVVIIKPTDPLPRYLADSIQFTPDGSITLLSNTTYKFLRNPSNSFIFAMNIFMNTVGRAFICVETNDDTVAEDKVYCPGLEIQVKLGVINLAYLNVAVNYTLNKGHGRIYFGFFEGSSFQKKDRPNHPWNVFIQDANNGGILRNETQTPSIHHATKTSEGAIFEFKVTNEIKNGDLQVVAAEVVGSSPEEVTESFVEVPAWTPSYSKLNTSTAVAISLCVVLGIIAIIEAVVIYTFSNYLIWPPSKRATEIVVPPVITSNSNTQNVDPSCDNAKTPKTNVKSADNPTSTKLSKVKGIFKFQKKETKHP